MEKYIDNIKAKKTLKDNGVSFINIDSVTIGKAVSIGEGSVIYPNVLIGNNVKIGKNTIIQNGVIIKDNVEIKDNVKIFDYAQILSNVKIFNNVNIGQFSIIRDDVSIGEGTSIGPSCEICRTKIGCKCVLGHKNYIGDAILLDGVKFGVNAVVVNSNWVNRYQTIIKDGALIGANVTLIAPIEIGSNCFVAAGTIVDQNIENNKFCISRNELKVKVNKS
ncbi:MAG: DapH/DapD/GlmU-related protein [Mycoplasma sp.]